MSRMNLSKGLLTVVVLLSFTVVAEQRWQKVVDDLSVPWGMVMLPDGDLVVTERDGEMFRVDPKDGIKRRVTGLPAIVAKGQGGLLDIILHPNYSTNGWLYFSYSSPEGEGEGTNTAVMRAKLKDTQLIEKQVVYKATPNSPRGHHFGSRLAFDRAGYLFFSIGDRGDRENKPQDLSQDGGKIYRVHDDGRIPTDNPFVKKEGAKSAVYSYGHRNPQGMARHPKSGDIWTHEHGPKGGDEINIIRKGKNYGWPVISYGVNYNGTKFTDLTEKEGMEQPEWYWVPSIAPSGMTFVTSDKYPSWKGRLLVGSLKFGHLALLKTEGNKVLSEDKVLEGIGRVRNVVQLSDGFIYVAVDGEGIFRIAPEE